MPKWVQLVELFRGDFALLLGSGSGPFLVTPHFLLDLAMGGGLQSPILGAPPGNLGGGGSSPPLVGGVGLSGVVGQAPRTLFSDLGDVREALLFTESAPQRPPCNIKSGTVRILS